MIFDRSTFQYGTPSFTFEVPSLGWITLRRGG
jgi:hypothetical protein